MYDDAETQSKTLKSASSGSRAKVSFSSRTESKSSIASTQLYQDDTSCMFAVFSKPKADPQTKLIDKKKQLNEML